MNKHQASVKTIYDWLDQVAPFEAQEEFDNAGFQLGRMDSPVSKVLLTLDVTEEVIQEAADLEAELIISHHPLIFSPIKNLDLKEHVPRLISKLLAHNISLISSHTNIDQSPQYSASAELARKLGLQNVRKEGLYLFLGDLGHEIGALDLAHRIEDALGMKPRLYGRPDLPIHTLAIAGGAYSDGFSEAMAAGAQGLLTGEVKHHHALEATSQGMVVFDGGHYATETPMLAPLAFGLQKAMNQVEYYLQVHVTGAVSYRLQ